MKFDVECYLFIECERWHADFYRTLTLPFVPTQGMQITFPESDMVFCIDFVSWSVERNELTAHIQDHWGHSLVEPCHYIDTGWHGSFVTKEAATA